MNERYSADRVVAVAMMMHLLGIRFILPPKRIFGENIMTDVTDDDDAPSASS